MRAFPCMIVLGILCTALAGCSTFNKKNTNTTQPAPGGGTAPAKFPNDPLLPAPPPPAFPNSPTASKAPTTILAGSVTDAYHNRVPGAYIRWVRLDEKDNAPPKDVPTDSNGYFIIEGVQPGAKYKLIARTKQGEQMMAGESLITAPNNFVVIAIRADLVTSSTPPLPSGPAYQVPAATKNTLPKDEPNLPTTIRVPAPSTDTPVANPTSPGPKTGWVPGVAEAPKDNLPMLNIKPVPIAPNDPPRPPIPGDTKLDTGPTRVPSCILVGPQLVNLALKDSKGQTWEYKKQGVGKIVLLDFWGTHCPPCRETMPILNRLNTQYGSRGLEIVGIALEAGQNERKEADAVNKLCTSMQVNYRQLMGRSAALDVGKQFKVEGLPTLLLLDEHGYIRWQHLGRPDAAKVAELERLIQTQLNNRSF
jgi:thiol-disulfide isomerase/thioredoxin